MDHKFFTHWGWVTHRCIRELAIIGSDNCLLPGRRQAIIWTNARILLIGPLGTNISEILFAIHTFSFKKMHLKTSAKRCPLCLGLNMLTLEEPVDSYSAVTAPADVLVPKVQGHELLFFFLSFLAHQWFIIWILLYWWSHFAQMVDEILQNLTAFHRLIVYKNMAYAWVY